MQTTAPTLTLEPLTRPDQPLVVARGSSLTLEASVANPVHQADRFRLICTQWPESGLSVLYPQALYPPSAAAVPPGKADCLRLGPQEQGTILMSLVPPLNLPAGRYTPTVRLVSANNPDLAIVERVYLEIPPAAAQPDLSAQQGVAIAKQPALQSTRLNRSMLLGFLAALGLVSLLGGLVWALGRSPRQPQIVDFYPEQSDYAAASREGVQLGWQIANPDQVGALKLSRYDARGKLVGSPVTYDFSGNAVANAGTNALESSLGSTPQASSGRASRQLPTNASGSSPEAPSSQVPETVATRASDGEPGLPAELRPFCTVAARLLNCRNVPIAVDQPGEYVFELTLLPKRPLVQEAQSKTSSLVAVQGLPQPTVAELAPAQVIYSEQGTSPGQDEGTLAPPVTSAGVGLSWVVAAPEGLQDLLLVVRQGDGTVQGGRRYSFRNPARPAVLTIPDALQPYCQLKAVLVCQNVPTGTRAVGRYVFELTALPVGQIGASPTPKQTEVVQIQPRPVRIASFLINGQAAQPRYLIPVEPGQVPGLVLSWNVEGGSTAQAALLPSPGTVPLRGSASFPINPAGETTLALQVTNGASEPIVRSVTITTFDPTPDGGAAAAAQAAQTAAQAAAQAAQAGSPRRQPTAPAPGPAARPTDAERLSPAEAPPKFD